MPEKPPSAFCQLTATERARVSKRVPQVEPALVVRAAAGGSIIRVEPTLRKLLEAAQLLMIEAEITASDQPRVELFGALNTYLDSPPRLLGDAVRKEGSHG